MIVNPNAKLVTPRFPFFRTVDPRLVEAQSLIALDPRDELTHQLARVLVAHWTGRIRPILALHLTHKVDYLLALLWLQRAIYHQGLQLIRETQ